MLLPLTLAAVFGPGGVSFSAPLLIDLYVDATADCVSGAGTISNPYCTIGEAVSVAVDGDVIRIAAGTYVETLDLTEDVALIGVDGREVTTIDGAQQGTVVTVQSMARVTLDGLTVTGGNQSGIVNAGALALLNSTVSGNWNAIGGGGGIVQLPGSGILSVRGCVISDNEAFFALGNAGTYGGGIYSVNGGDIDIVGSTLSGNIAEYGSGIDALLGGAVRLDGTTVQAPSGFGSAVSVNGHRLDIINSTISSGFFGLTTNLSGPGSIRHSTIKGGASLNASGAIEVSNTLISAPAPFTTAVIGSYTSLGNNIIATEAQLDPRLGPLADNGGPTPTHRPLFGSPLIDAGNQSVFEPLDQRGVPRVAGYVDIGAVEGGFGDPITVCVSTPNSTGEVGLLAATGSPAAADDNFTLTLSSLPPSELALFVASRTQGFTANPGGSAGNLCLGGAIGRFLAPGQVMDSGPGGVVLLEVPLSMIPQGSVFSTVQSGDTWSFQGWHRDTVGGGATSNFSTGLAVTFF